MSNKGDSVSSENLETSIKTVASVIDDGANEGQNGKNDTTVYPCSVCQEPVTWEHDDAVQCDPISTDADAGVQSSGNHWTHRWCLEKICLLNGNKVPLTHGLFQLLNSMEFTFHCPACKPGALPLPIQFFQQGKVSVSELKLAGICTADVDAWLDTQRAKQKYTSTSTPLISIRTDQSDQPSSPVTCVDSFFPPFNIQTTSSYALASSSGWNQNPVFGGSVFSNASMAQTTTPWASNTGTSFVPNQNQNPSWWGGAHSSLFRPPTQNPPVWPSQNYNQPSSNDAGMAGIIQGLMNLMQQQQQFFSHMLNNQGSANPGESQRTNTPRNGGGETAAATVTSGGFSKLPKVEVPMFSGNILEWPSFWDMFQEMVGKHDRFSDIEKLHFLLTRLSGEAKRAVENYKLEAENYQNVVLVLKERFDDKKKIRAAHLQALMALPSVPKFDMLQLQKFRDSVDSHARALIALHGNDDSLVDIECSMIVPCLFEKLPMLLRDKLYQHGGENVQSQLSQFRVSLKEQLRVQGIVQGQSWLNPINPNPAAKALNQTRSPGGTAAKGFKPTGSGMVAMEKGKGGGTPSKNYNWKKGNNTPKREKYCHFCEVKNEHRSFECPVYPTVTERKAKIGRTCYICLKKDHLSRECPTKGKFSCYSCKSENHNSALCSNLDKQSRNRNSGGSNPQRAETSAKTEIETGASNESGNFSADIVVEQAYQQAESEFSSLFEGNEDVAMQTVVTTIRNPETSTEMVVSVLLDTGSKRTYVAEKIACQIGLIVRREQTLGIATFNTDERKSIKAGIADFEIKGKNSSYIGLTGNVVKTITSGVTLGEIPLSDEDKQLTAKLKMADPNFERNRQFHVDILIGNDFYAMLLEKQKLQLKKSGVCILDTKFGWVTSGIMQGKQNNPGAISENLSLLIGNLTHKPIELVEDSLDSHLKDLRQFETIGIKDPKESDQSDDLALKQFKDTVKMENGRVSVKWLKKESCHNLPTNFPVALRRLNSLLKTLGKNEEYREKYSKNFSDQLEKGVVEKVAPDMNKGFLTHYIPHHAVLTPQRTTTKMRVVFDASAKLNKNSKSLNECLLRGPNLLPDLCGLIVRVRFKNIAIIADIEKAFLQVSLQESDRDLTRFLWLKDPTKLSLENNLQIYRFCRVPFGFKTSPFLLAGSLCFLLERAQGPEKPIADKILKGLYVDNLITGTETVETAVELYKTAKKLFADGQMNLREWTSNSTEFLSHIPDVDKVKNSTVKLLGFNWDTQNDELSLCIKHLESFSEARTKRQILGCVASIFDPLNLLCCLKVRGMIFLQEIWKLKVGWDDPLSDEMIQKWQSIVKCLQLIPEISLKRCAFTLNKEDSVVDLLCFCDASMEAYTTVVYLRLNDTGDFGKISLVFAKVRLSPISGLSIPRAELMAALIGTRCLKYVENQLQIPIRNRYLWTDSQCVLGWIKKESRDQGVFVTNRILEILKSDKVTFGYIPTNENPADLASKSRDASYEVPWELWWEGPLWLKNPVETWPKFEVEPVRLCSSPTLLGGGSQVKNPAIDLEAVIDLDKNYWPLITLVRITSWVLRFVKNLTQKIKNKAELSNSHSMRTRAKGLAKAENVKNIAPLEREELKNAQSLWYRSVQKKAFPDLFTKRLGQSNLAQSLKLRLREDGILRCGGRFGQSELSPEAKSPILLPSKSNFTNLVIWTFHNGFLHSGVNYTLAKLRSRFWIPKGRAMVANVLKKCNFCKPQRAVPFAHPPMPDLPKERVSMAAPFTFTGVDYFGPLFCRNAETKKEQKIWVILFTCLTIRAIHLEVVTDMSAQTFLGALRRFVARKGKPNTILSNNALQFKMTKKVLKEAEMNRLDTLVQTHCNNAGINWKFIPEIAPWTGGVYERMVGVTKAALKKALGRSALTLDQFHTVLVEVEQIVNSRPITFVNMSENDMDLEILTPQKFLTSGRCENLPILPEYDPSDPEFFVRPTNQTKVIQAWKRGQYYLNKFWYSWRDNYLLSLRERHASDKFPNVKSQIFRSPKIGEIVLVKNENLPRGLWKLGKIVKLQQGRDNLIRSAEVQIPGCRDFITRPVSLLFPLEIQSETADSKTPAESNLTLVNLDNYLEMAEEDVLTIGVSPDDSLVDFIEPLSDEESEQKPETENKDRKKSTTYVSPLMTNYKIPRKSDDLRNMIEDSKEKKRQSEGGRGKNRPPPRQCTKCPRQIPASARYCVCEFKEMKQQKKSQRGHGSTHWPTRGVGRGRGSSHGSSRGPMRGSARGRASYHRGGWEKNPVKNAEPAASTSSGGPSTSHGLAKMEVAPDGTVTFIYK